MAYNEVEIGKVYDGYEDGKSGRLTRIVIDDVLTRSDMNKKAQRLWKRALKEDFTSVFEGCSWHCGPKGLLDPATTKQFWDWNCDTFLVGHILDDKETMKDPIFFAKRPTGFGWYSVNWNYSLDPSGGIRRRCLKEWKKAAEEKGLTMKLNRKTGYYDYYAKNAK